MGVGGASTCRPAREALRAGMRRTRLRVDSMINSPDLEEAIWSIADGRGSADDLARLHADERSSRMMLDRLMLDVEGDLDAARSLIGDERDRVVADLAENVGQPPERHEWR